MADSDLVDLTELTTPAGTDIVYIVDDPAGTPLDRKVSLATVFESTFTDVILGKSNTLEKATLDNGDGYVVIGEGNTVDDLPNVVVIGSQQVVNDVPLWGGSFGEQSVAIGHEIEVHCGRCVAIGSKAQAHSVSCTAIGGLSAAFQAHDVAIGRGAQTIETVSDANLVVLGSASNLDLYIGCGAAHRYTDPAGNVIDKIRSTETRTIHGGDSFDDVDGTDTNQAGGDLRLAGGRGTGSGVGGSVRMAISRTGAGANVKNTLVDVMELDDDNTADQTAMLLWADGSLQRVSVGATDSGGSGFRVLRIPN